MTADARPTFLKRVLDVTFGKASTPEEWRLLEASRPPQHFMRVFSVLHVASAVGVLTTFLWMYGWLPFVGSRIDMGWFILALGINIVLRFGWERVEAHYTRLALAAEQKAASPE